MVADNPNYSNPKRPKTSQEILEAADVLNALKDFLKSQKNAATPELETVNIPTITLTPFPSAPVPMGIPGWICPVCGRGNAPHLSTCSCKPVVAPTITC